MFELHAKIRDKIGRGLHLLRKEGYIPAILYGQKTKNITLKVDKKEFKEIYSKTGESELIKLKITRNLSDKDNKEKDERVVLIHDIQKDPISDEFIHIDFYQVRMDKPITVEIPLVFTGESPAVKTEGGVLVKNIKYVEVEALPLNLPKEIEVDISSLKTFDDNIYIKDIKLPSNVKINADPEEVVASVVPPKEEEEVPEVSEEKIEETKEKKAKSEEEAVEETKSEEKPE